jgi:gliding motility-associated-like protein
MKSRLLFLAFFTFVFQHAFAQDFSNKGTDFWLCFPSHVPSGANNIAKMALFLTSNQNSSGTIKVGSFSTTFTVTANQIAGPIDIPYSVAHILTSESGTPVNKGIHVEVDAGKPAVVLYAHVYASARSEASLILPTNVLGKKYLSMNYIQNTGTNFFSQFNIVAVEANTTVKYQLRKNGVLESTVTTKELPNVGDVLQIQDKADLTGSIIESTSSTGASCKKIAVFSGSSAVNIGLINGGTAQAGSSTDPLFQQCYPVNTWGRNFGMVPFVTGSSPFHYRVLASENNTNVSIDGQAVTLNAGEYYPSHPSNLQQVAVNKPFLISSDKPISVAQYMLSSNVNGYGSNNGDPEMILLNPIEQNIADISVFSSKLEVIRSQYINIFTRYNNIGSLKINGSAPKSAFVRMPAPNDAYAYLIEDLTNYGTNSFRITSDSGFNGICYGIGNVESYGYSAGTSVKDFTKIASFQNPYKRIDSAVSCVNTPFQFSVPLSNIPQSITWDFSAAPNITPNTQVGPQLNPISDSIVSAGGQNLYYFSNKNTYSFTNPNTALVRDTIKVYTTSTTPDGCGSTEQTYLIPVKVSPLPIADFAFTASCITDSVRFRDATSNIPESFVEKAIWTFDDGTTDSVPNPNKKYSTPKTYNVRYQPISSYGCIGDVTKPVTVTAPPVAGFTHSANTCAGNQVTFTDASTIASPGTIVKWIWSFGEGNRITNTTGAPVTYTYAAVGQYTATLEVESNTGCKSQVFSKVINVTPLPVANIVLPEVCLSDAFAQFTDSSFISDGSQGSFTYLWNFGDNNANTTNPNTSTSKDPRHKYSAVGIYKVSMTVTSKDGCSSTITKDFTVNGSIPVANFNVLNSAGLCSNTKVEIQNNSTVDFGTLTKVEIVWDAANEPTTVFTDRNPSATAIYSHNYPVLSNTKNYQVTFRAFSGGTCVNETTKTLTVNGSPKVSFTAIPNICVDANAIQITQSSEVTGVSGSFAFAGNGITPAGFFTPSVAGVGQTSIKYTYTTNTGCRDSATMPITVLANPKVDAGPDLFILEGGSATINAKASGNGLSFLWTPATYLSSTSILNPMVVPLADKRYKLTVTAEGGCTASDEVFVKVLVAPEVPGAFSPNKDGINDTWNIQYLETYPGAIIEVFNRYGQIVYRSTGYPKQWDGTVNGNPLPVGVYYYIINPKNGRKQITGSVTILR